MKEQSVEKEKLIELLKNLVYPTEIYIEEALAENGYTKEILKILTLDEFISLNLPLEMFQGNLRDSLTEKNVSQIFNSYAFLGWRNEKLYEISYYIYKDHNKWLKKGLNNLTENYWLKNFFDELDGIKKHKEGTNLISEVNKDRSKFLLEYLFENGLEPSNENLSLNINCPIYENYKFMKKSIKHNSDAIVYAKMDTDSFEKLLKIAKRKNFNFSFENLSKFNKDCSAFYSDEFIKEAINVDCNNIIYSRNLSTNLISYAINKGFDLSYKNLSRFDKKNDIFSNNEFIMKAIEFDSQNLIFYKQNSMPDNLLKKTLENNFNFSFENLSKIKDYNLSNIIFENELFMEKAIQADPNNLKFFNNAQFNYEDIILKYNLKISPKILKKLYSNEITNVKELIDQNPENIIFIFRNNKNAPEELLEYAIEKGFKLTYENLSLIPDNIFKKFTENSELEKMIKLIDIDLNNILLYKGYNLEVLKYAEKKGFKLDYNNLSKLDVDSGIFRLNDKFEYFLDIDPNNIFLYKGLYEIKKQMLKYAIEKGFKITPENSSKFNTFDDSSIIILIENNPNYIRYYNKNDKNVIMCAIENGFKLTYENLNSLACKNVIFSDEMLMNIAIKHDIRNLLEYNGEILRFNFYKEKLKINNNENVEELIKKYEKVYNEYSDVMVNYKGDKIKFLLNEEIFSSFLEKISFNKDTFIQYNFGVDYDFLTDIIQISKNSENLETFCSFTKSMSKYYDNNVFDRSKMLISLLENYNRYPELCENIEKNNVDLTDVQFSQLTKLFKSKIDFNGINVSEMSDLDKIDEILMDKFQIDYDNSNDISEKMDNLCKMIFGYSNQEIEEILKKYGNTARLKQLIFDNKCDEKIKSKIELYLGYTTAFEMLLNENNIENLDYLFENIKKNSDVIFEINSLFENYQEEMRKLYAYETNENLTKKDYIDETYLETMIDKEKSEKYGVNVYDYSNKNYILLAHVKSGNESVDQIVNGLCKNGEEVQNYICLSAVSYIKQGYYYDGERDIIFGYDSLPVENFIVSSPNNMGSNGEIKQNDISTPNIENVQYGVRDTSNTNGNSEYLCLREGLKPCCIILPNGREATDEEISIAKEYGLYFVKTQEKNASLKSSPEEIKYKSKSTIEKEKYDEMSSKISQLQKMMGKKLPRKIAIFTDSHGLYEPTLEALEDARKDGVTEIYSLGDNIGTGSNPGEVIDLLEEYNVKSLKGNHEIYALDGIDSMSGHLSSYAMKEEAKKNSDWTKSKLTSEQIEEIRKCPEELEIEIGGKKVLLCHHTKDYNTGKEKYDTDKYDDVFQGHEHFESGNKNIHTVRAVGMGYSSYDPKGIASYIELVEKPDGNGYDIIKRTVNYSLERSKREIDESDAPSEDKEKISNWIR